MPNILLNFIQYSRMFFQDCFWLDFPKLAPTSPPRNSPSQTPISRSESYVDQSALKACRASCLEQAIALRARWSARWRFTNRNAASIGHADGADSLCLKSV